MDDSNYLCAWQERINYIGLLIPNITNGKKSIIVNLTVAVKIWGLVFEYILNKFDIWICCSIQYIPRKMHTVFALLCFVVVIHWLIFPYPSGLLHWHCGNLTIAPVPAKQPWWIWINTSCEFIINDCITTTKQSTTKPCAYCLGYTVYTFYPARFNFNGTIAKPAKLWQRCVKISHGLIGSNCLSIVGPLYYK